CEFINAIRCGRKIAVDTSRTLATHAGTGVEALVGDVPGVLGQLGDNSVHVVFSSNFLEHLADKDTVLAVLGQIHRLLVGGGRVIILQPNIRYAYKEYWDFFDHHVALSHNSLSEALQISGFEVETVRPRFLPYTPR